MIRQRGFTLMEVICAFAVLVVISTAAVVGGRGHLAGIGRSYDELAASRQAASHLERIEQIEVGETTFPVDPEVLLDATGRRIVRELAPGLFEVTVTVEWGESGRFELTTLMEQRR
ncbi:MAG: type IV pilus modification PilV family protein [Planctomycetota bacterium]